MDVKSGYHNANQTRHYQLLCTAMHRIHWQSKTISEWNALSSQSSLSSDLEQRKLLFSPCWEATASRMELQQTKGIYTMVYWGHWGLPFHGIVWGSLPSHAPIQPCHGMHATSSSNPQTMMAKPCMYVPVPVPVCM